MITKKVEMKTSRSLFWSFYGGICFSLTGLFLVGMFMVKHYNYYYRFVPVSDLSSYHYIFKNDTSDPLLLSKYKGSDPVDIMQKVMNTVSSRKQCLTSGTETDFFNHVMAEKGVTCAGIAEIYLHALRLNGFTARKLFAVKDIGNDFATHTIVEVLQDDKWVMYDPTFNISCKKDGNLLGAQEIYAALIDGSYKDIETIFYGEVLYPARIETYPIDYFYHFNNVILITPFELKANFILRNTVLLPLRYWYGPKIHYLISNGFKQNHLETLNWVYFMLIVILPILLFGLVCIPIIVVNLKRLKLSNGDPLDPS
jgi:hypothetical protein